MFASLADLATVIVAAMLIWWWAVTAGNPHGSIEPSSAELAYLRSGATLALLSSLAWLRAAGAVASSWNKQVVAIAPVPAGADPLGQAIHSALRSSAPWSALALNPRVAGELNRVRRRLIWRGWLLREHQRRRMRALAIIPAAAWLGSLFIRDEHGGRCCVKPSRDLDAANFPPRC
jgi:uncharacterized protein (TIGR04222 family)